MPAASRTRETDASGKVLVGRDAAGLRAPGSCRARTSSRLGRFRQTVALVDAHDDPNAETDLAVYRAQFGLPACTTANGCFKKVNQSGSEPYPAARQRLGRRDLARPRHGQRHLPDAARSSSSRPTAPTADLGAAVNMAAPGRQRHQQQLRRQRGLDGHARPEQYYNHPGVAHHRELRRQRLRRQFPAVVAVRPRRRRHEPRPDVDHRARLDRGRLERRRQRLQRSTSPSPAWQTDTGCAKRTVADVSAVADPNTGVAVYDTYGERRLDRLRRHERRRRPSWRPSSRSRARPAQTAASTRTRATSTTSPPAATAPAAAYLCTAGPGYDGPTGLGTPNATLRVGSGSGSSSGSSSGGSSGSSGGSSGSGSGGGSGSSGGKDEAKEAPAAAAAAARAAAAAAAPAFRSRSSRPPTGRRLPADSPR